MRNEDKNNLSPCPFCGGTNIKHAIYSSSGSMECKDCNCLGPDVIPDYDIEAAEKAWNNRDNSDAKTAAVGPTTNVDTVLDKLPDIATLRHLVERTGNGEIVFYGNPESMSNIKEFLEHYEHDVIDELNEFKRPQLDFVIKAHDGRYMLLEPEIKPVKKDPFWTQQGKRTKGKRGRY